MAWSSDGAKVIKSGRNSAGEKITLTEIEIGLYFLQIDTGKVCLQFKLIKA
jgi:hypothetical protein